MFRGLGDWLNDIREQITDLVQSVLGVPPDEPEVTPPEEPEPEDDFYSEPEPEDPEDFYEDPEDYEDDYEDEEDPFDEFDFDPDAEPEDDDYIYPYEADASDIRKVRYATYDDAANFLLEAGLAAFSRVVFFPEDDTYGIAVEYEEPR